MPTFFRAQAQSSRGLAVAVALLLVYVVWGTTYFALGMALETMGELFDGMVDVTIVYPGGVPTFMDLMTGRIDEIIVNVRQRPIPKELLVDAQGRAADRALLQRWINDIWAEKDAEITQVKAASAAGRPAR